MKFTKETWRRALRTFIQTFIPALVVGLKEIDFSGDKEYIKGAVIALLIPTFAAAIAAAMNLEPSEMGGGTMTFDKFVKTYLGKGTDFDNYAGVQCVDLAKLFINKVLGVNPQSIGNAHAYYDDFDNTYLKQHFVKIKYTKGVKSKKGDLVVWGKKYNGISKYGHIAIATGKQTDAHITTYDQNWGGKPMKEVTHSLDGVAGFLRPIDQSNINPKKKYYKKYTGQSVSIVDALDSLNIDYSFYNRKRIAKANRIKAYAGTAKQNTKMLTLLKKGKLIKP